MLVCDVVGGTSINEIVSLLNVPGGSSCTRPCRYGMTDAKKKLSAIGFCPEYEPEPAMTRSL